MAVLKFNNYHVNNITYFQNKDKNFSNLEVNPDFYSKINFDEKNQKATLILGIKVVAKSAFKLDVEIEGSFSYDFEKDNSKIGFKTLLTNNGVAILYPYLRSIVSSVTGLSNEFPQLLLPTINVSELLKKKANN